MILGLRTPAMATVQCRFAVAQVHVDKLQKRGLPRVHQVALLLFGLWRCSEEMHSLPCSEESW